MAATRMEQHPASAERALRIDLAIMFRIAVQFGWHESVGNHFSVAVGTDGKRFLMNPRWRHFGAIRASDLQLLDSSDPGTMDRADAPDLTAWCIHGRLHAALPAARCVLHVHPPYATAIAALADPSIPPIDQNTARYYQRIAIDKGYTGLADTTAEGDRLASVLGSKRALLMGNHGVLVVAPTIAEAFEDLYFLERACQTLVLAYSTGRPLAIMSDEVAERTARGWEPFAGMAFAHFAALRAEVLARSPEVAD